MSQLFFLTPKITIATKMTQPLFPQDLRTEMTQPIPKQDEGLLGNPLLDEVFVFSRETWLGACSDPRGRQEQASVSTMNQGPLRQRGINPVCGWPLWHSLVCPSVVCQGSVN